MEWTEMDARRNESRKKMKDLISAALLLDLQFDFLNERGRMPVTQDDANTVIRAANAILAGQALQGVRR